MHGVVIIEIYSHNKLVNTLYTVVTSLYIPPKCVKTRKPEDKCCVLWCTYIIYNICDPIPLDNLKNHTHTALPYITWGLIQDFKNETERSQLINFTGLSSGISKIREGISMQTSHKERRENPSCKIHCRISFQK